MHSQATGLQTSQRLTFQEQLVDEAEAYVRQPGAELGQGLWQLKEAMCLLTAGAHQGFHAGRVVLQSGELLLCREGQLVPHKLGLRHLPGAPPRVSGGNVAHFQP